MVKISPKVMFLIIQKNCFRKDLRKRLNDVINDPWKMIQIIKDCDVQSTIKETI